jgi:SAM-dependent methyltransferase
MSTKYDRIGTTYTSTRRTDPRVAAAIEAALGGARTVVNIGAGTGSYEPRDRRVIAVEPSQTMLGQRARDGAPAVRAVAEDLPFPTAAFDAALAVLTVHHWADLERGAVEMRRVARRQVIFFFEPEFAGELWLLTDYLPEILDLPSERSAPGVDRLRDLLDVQHVFPVPIPADCVDGFGGCYWNRPEAYLDPVVRGGMSSFAQLDPALCGERIERLRADLASGAWDMRHGHLRAMNECDLGYRLLVAG